LPALAEDEYTALRADIQEHGVIVPIVIDEDKNVIDGQHRLLIAAELGWKDIPFEIRPGLDETDKKRLACGLNLHRRHLTRKQREQLALTLRQDGLSYRQIGEALRVSHEQVRRDVESTVTDVAVDLPDRIIGRDGKVRPANRPPSVIAKNMAEMRRASESLQQMDVGKLPGKTLDTKRVARLAREQKAAERGKRLARDTTLGDVTLLFGDFREKGMEIDDESVDLIFTDPPYAGESLQLWSDLAKFALRVLKPSGLLLAYSGQAHLPQVLAAMDEHLQWMWQFKADHTGGDSPRWDLNIRNTYKPIVVYCKPPLSVWWELVSDSVTGGREKGLHDFQQAEAETASLLREFTRRGGLVVDPMCGSGTTAAAALRLGLRCIAIEIDQSTYNAATERLQELREELTGDRERRADPDHQDGSGKAEHAG